MKIWVGSPTDVRKGHEAEKALQDVNDSKYWNQFNGIVKVDDERWERAQKYELEGWKQHWVNSTSDRNHQHKQNFKNYEKIPQNLGYAAEIGCGQFTQLATILEGRAAEKIDLYDPLIKEYQGMPNCTYGRNPFHPNITTYAQKAEESIGIEKYDTIVCINVLEHVQDAQVALDNIRQALKVGGTLVLGERYYDGFNPKNIYDVGHPIRPKLHFFQLFLSNFKGLSSHLTKPDGDVLSQEIYFIGSKT